MTATRRARLATRPQVHFTADRGWLNDPHGICWANGEYHLFYQHNPDHSEWMSPISWGHATSPDLVRWQRQPIALAPHADEAGCWTGAVLVEDGMPTIYYTSVPEGHWNDGRIAIAHPDADLREWHSTPDDVIIGGPPADLNAVVFRDPCIVATDTGWTMVVGVGVATEDAAGTGLAVHYSSTDARTWTYVGVLCERSGTERDGVWTGGVWECPQFFRVGDDWVLAVSVWDADTLHYVAAAVGSFDGVSFTANRWSRLTHDDISYAMTSFADKDGRPCVMFWLREDSDHQQDNRDYTGALSVPMVVGINADRTVSLQPHPDVDALRRPLSARELPEHAVIDLEITLTDEPVAISLTDGDHEVIRMVGEPGLLTVQRAGDAPALVPLAGHHARIVLDAEILAVFGGDGTAALRFSGVPTALSVHGPLTDLTLATVTP